MRRTPGVLARHRGWLFAVVLAFVTRSHAAEGWSVTDSLDATAAPQVGEYVTELFVDRRGTLWMGTLTEGLCRHDDTGFRCVGVDEGYTSGALRAVAQDAQGALWFGGQSGLTRWDGERFTAHTMPGGRASTQIWSLLIDRHGRLWVGTEGGVYRRRGTRFEAVDLPGGELPDATPRFTSRLAFAMTEDRQGNVWLGMDGGGVLKFDGDRCTRYTRSEGLASNDVTAIVEDRDGALWFTSRTGGGITRFDGQAFRRFGAQEGLPAEEAWAAYRDRRGRLWFGTAGGGVARWDGTRFHALRDTTGVTRNHVQSIVEDARGVMWFGFSGGLFRLVPAGLPGRVDRLVNVTRLGPWDP
jgi:ligand-binding sensor domain-containing protein